MRFLLIVFRVSSCFSFRFSFVRHARRTHRRVRLMQLTDGPGGSWMAGAIMSLIVLTILSFLHDVFFLLSFVTNNSLL